MRKPLDRWGYAIHSRDIAVNVAGWKLVRGNCRKIEHIGGNTCQGVCSSSGEYDPKIAEMMGSTNFVKTGRFVTHKGD